MQSHPNVVPEFTGPLMSECRCADNMLENMSQIVVIRMSYGRCRRRGKKARKVQRKNERRTC